MSRLNRRPEVGPDVGQRATVAVDGVLRRVGLQVHRLAAEDGLGLRRGLSAEALHRFSRVDRLGGVQADHPDLEALAVGVHVDGVTVDNLDTVNGP